MENDLSNIDLSTGEILMIPDKPPETTKPEVITKTMKKKAMVKELIKTRGGVTEAARNLGIERTLHYDWLKDDPKYKAAIDKLKEFKSDIIEKSFYSLVEDFKNPAAVIFGMKTLVTNLHPEYKEPTINVKNTNINLDVEFTFGEDKITDE